MDDNAWRQLIAKATSRWLSRWRGYALTLTGNLHDAEEAVQEALARTLNARPPLKSEEEANRYVITAVRTAAIQVLRFRSRHHQLDETRPLWARPGTSPLQVVLTAEADQRQEELQELALRHLKRLKPEQRQVVELLILREPPLKLRQVAEIQSAPISTVHSRLKAAVEKLGRRMREETEGERRAS